jgi:hypothetical protein
VAAIAITTSVGIHVGDWRLRVMSIQCSAAADTDGDGAKVDDDAMMMMMT